MEYGLCRKYLRAKNKSLPEVVFDELANASDVTYNRTLTSTSETKTENNASYIGFEWFEIVIPIVCVFGIVGNALNLAVLTRRRHTSGMDGLGRTANCGLVALAFSDLLFCLTVFPHTFITTANNQGAVFKLLVMYYRLYGIACINLFIMISTWLIVTMAIKRLLVVIYPLHARDYITQRRTYVLLTSVYVISVLFTAPHYLHLKIATCSAPGGELEYQYTSRWTDADAMRTIKFYVRWVWPLLAGFIPVIILIVCNYRLIKELRNAKLTRQNSCPGQQVKDSGHKVTLILVIIVLMLLVLVAPSEVLKYINPYRAWGKTGHMIASITNVLQTVNFAFNFLLYFTVSAKFRNTAKSMFFSHRACSSGSGSTDSYLSMKMVPRSGNSVSGRTWTLRMSQGSDV